MIHPSPDELTRFADGVSFAAERERLAEHVSACPSCRETLGAWARAEELLTEEEIQAPAGYFEDLPERLLARLASAQGENTEDSKRVPEVGSSTERAFGTRVASSPVRRPRVARWVFAVAAALFVAVLAPWTLRRSLEEFSPTGSVSGTAARPGPGSAPQLAAPSAGLEARAPATLVPAPSALAPSDAARQDARAKLKDEARSGARPADRSPSAPNDTERQSSEPKREATPIRSSVVRCLSVDVPAVLRPRPDPSPRTRSRGGTGWFLRTPRRASCRCRRRPP